MNTTPRPKRSIPLPLWLQGAIELFLVALIFYPTVVLLLTAVWYTKGFNDNTLAGALSLAGHIWLLVHGVPLAMEVPEQGGFAAVSGTMSLVPLGLTLIPLALCYRAGRRLARASYEGQFWLPVAGGMAAYALVGAGVSLLSAGEQFATSLVLAALIPLWVVLLGLIAGGYAESRSLAAMIGVNAADWVKQFSQYSRWAGSYLWTLIRASLISVLAFIAGGALLFSLNLFWHWADVLTLYQVLHAGAVGGAALTLLQLGLIPNLIVYAMAWSSGAGFALGENTLVSPHTTSTGVLPALPLLGAIPQAQEPWSYLAYAVPLLAGAVGGWWFFGAGENHLDEWFSLKIRFRWLSWPLSTLGMALASIIPTFITILALGWAANGSLGIGRFTSIGPNPLIFASFSALWLAGGMILGLAAAHLLVRDTSYELERFAADAPQASPKTKHRNLKRSKRRPLALAPALPALADSSNQAEQDDQGDPVGEGITRLPGTAPVLSSEESPQETDKGQASVPDRGSEPDQASEEELAPETSPDPVALEGEILEAGPDSPAEASQRGKAFRPVVKRPKALRRKK